MYKYYRVLSNVRAPLYTNVKFFGVKFGASALIHKRFYIPKCFYNRIFKVGDDLPGMLCSIGVSEFIIFLLYSTGLNLKCTMKVFNAAMIELTVNYNETATRMVQWCMRAQST